MSHLGAGMSRPLFRPTLRQTIVLAAIGAVALGYGFATRYLAIEQSSVGLACQGGLDSLVCANRRAAIALYTPQAFGLTALVAALLNLLRPSLVLCAVALAAGGAGIVLYNVAFSALAVALLLISLARPAPEAD
jgi:hypothetical protein